MTGSEDLLIRNLLNGVDAASAARAVGLTEEEALAAFREAMRRIAEYRVVHCMPFFDCVALSAARTNRTMVLQALEDITRWDERERELMIATFKEQRPQCGREEQLSILRRTLDALPFYLELHELRQYNKDRMAFVRERRSRVIGLLERFVSFRTPLLYKNIEHQGIALASV